MPRFHCPTPLRTGQSVGLPAGAARHVQVLRLQPGAHITLFNGEGGEFGALIERIGRNEVDVLVQGHVAMEREARRPVHLAVGMIANERMDWLIEKATELGAASIQPLSTERGVLKLQGERASRKQAHWQSIAVAACEQCGRNRVPVVHAPQPLQRWLEAQRVAPVDRRRWILSLAPSTQLLLPPNQDPAMVTLLSGPEGGFSPIEEQAAQAGSFMPVSLGPRVLRAETAALAALSRCTE
jgi:16S rRNA (uracil1498-N3)-methyltransferase